MARNPYAPILQTAGSAYGVNPELLTSIARRESSFDADVVNTWDSNAKAGIPSAGLMQFIEPTFNAYARQARKANPAAWRGVPMKWKNPYAQALAASWAIANGKGKAWATYKDALAEVGGSARGPRGASPAPASAASAGSVGESMTGGFTDPQQAAIAMVFKDNPRMQRLLAMAGEQRVPAAHSSGDAHDHAPSGGPGPGSNYKDIIKWARDLAGAEIQGNFQTTGGRHSVGSNHYKRRAVDYGDANTSPAQFRRIAAFARRNPHHFKEFYFNKLGWGIKNGRIIKGLKVPGHDDHLHIAV